jgi:hypothetical protein
MLDGDGRCPTTTTGGQAILDALLQYWREERDEHLQAIANLERRIGVSPTTSELRRWWRDGLLVKVD